MEEFQLYKAFDNDKLSKKVLLSPLDFQKTLNLHKDKLNECFQSPLITSETTPKLNFPTNETANFLTLSWNKDDDFSLENHQNAKMEVEEPGSSAHENQHNKVHLDINFGTTQSTKFHDYDIDSYRISRSRVPSFNISREKPGSEDLFGNDIDFRLIFENLEKHQNDQNINEPHPDNNQSLILSQEENESELYDFPGYLPEQLRNTQEDEENGQETAPHSIALEPTTEQNLEDDQSFEEQLTTTKKKRKVNNIRAIVIQNGNKKTSIKLQAVKKHKIQPQKTISTTSSTPTGNATTTISLKPRVKRNRKSASQKTQEKVASQKSIDEQQQQVKEEDTVKTEETKADSTKSIENNPTPTPTPIPQVKPVTPFDLKHSFSNLFQGLNFPAEVEAVLTKSKLLNSFQWPIVKKIGPLTVEERRVKVEQYLKKRKERTWNKRINYDCRKRVADSRLRFKGRFVTKSQASVMLKEIGVYFDIQKTTEPEIKELLEKHLGGSIQTKDEHQDENNLVKVRRKDSNSRLQN